MVDRVAWLFLLQNFIFFLPHFILLHVACVPVHTGYVHVCADVGEPLSAVLFPSPVGFRV